MNITERVVKNGKDTAALWHDRVPESALVTKLPLGMRIKQLPSFLGYRWRDLILLILVGFGMTLSEGFGVALMLPIFAKLEGKIDPTESSWVTETTVSLLGLAGFPASLGNLIAIAATLVILLQFMIFNFVWFQAKLRNQAITHCRAGIYCRFLESNIALAQRLRTGTMQNAIIVEAEVAAGTGLLLIQYAVILMKLVFYVALSIIISWQATLVIGGAMLAIGLVTTRAAVLRSGAVGELVVKAKDSLSRYVSDRVRMIALIKVSGTENIESQQFLSRNRALAKKRLALARLDAMMQAFIEPTALLLGLIAMYIAVEVANVSLSSIGIFVVIMFRMLPVVRSAMTARQKIASTWASVTYIDRLQALATKYNSEDGGTKPMPSLSTGIAFDHVSFSYEDDSGNKTEALRELCLTIPTNSLTALVGPSGAGKTTVMELLARLRTPSEGRILFDDSDMREIRFESLRSSQAMLAQDTPMIDGTVQDNIVYGAIDKNKASVEAAAKSAHAHDFIASLPYGYDTTLGEQGTSLSGGQRQRIGLARALLRQTPLLLLDEPTSALDAESDLEIQKALEELRAKRNTTIVVIAHRMSTIKNADHIVALEDGKLLAEGSHDEMMKISDWYRRAIELQLSEQHVISKRQEFQSTEEHKPQKNPRVIAVK